MSGKTSPQPEILAALPVRFKPGDTVWFWRAIEGTEHPKCPTCDGKKRIKPVEDGAERDCPTCRGKGSLTGERKTRIVPASDVVARVYIELSPLSEHIRSNWALTEKTVVLREGQRTVVLNGIELVLEEDVIVRKGVETRGRTRVSAMYVRTTEAELLAEVPKPTDRVYGSGW